MTGWIRQSRPWGWGWASVAQQPDLCPLLPSPDSGYLFSGSRPPSQMSPSGEAPVSGKRKDGEAAPVWLNMNLGAKQVSVFKSHPCASLGAGLGT